MNQNPSNKKEEFEFEIEDLSIEPSSVEVEVKADQELETGITSSRTDISNVEDEVPLDNTTSSNLDEMEDDRVLENPDSNVEDVSSENIDDLEKYNNVPDDIDDNNFEKLEDEANKENISEEDKEQLNPDTKESDKQESESNGNNENPDSDDSKVDNTNQKSHEGKDESKPEVDSPNSDKNDYSSQNKSKNENDEKTPINKGEENQPKNGLERKRQDLKDKQNNRPKSMKDAKDRMKNKGSNLKDRMKNGAKNRVKNMANNAKEGFENSGLGQGIDKAKNAVDKAKKIAKVAKKADNKIIKTGKEIANIVNFFIGIWPVIVVLIVIIVVACIVILLPGNNGDTNNEFDNYSKADQKTIEKLRKIFNKYPNVDATLAMATVAYPYNNILWSSEVNKLVSKDYKDELDDASVEEYEEGDDTEEIIKETTDKVSDDIYLNLFKKSSYRNNLKSLLKKLNDEGENAYFVYLRNYYFEKDKGYKSMLEGVSDEDTLKDLIIEDIKNNKDLFVNYVYTNAVCASTLVDAGQIETSELLKGNILVDLKKPGCSNMKSCSESYYDNYLTLEEYVKGVVYEEIAGNTDVNQIAAQMVAAKTFTLSRRTGSIMIDASTGAYVIPMLWSTADQDFCHVELGCNADDITAHYGYERGNDTRLFHGANRPAASEEQKALYNEAWNLSKDVWVVNEDGSAASVSYYAGCPSNGKCMDQEKLPNYTNIEYKSILSTFYSSYSIATVEGDVSTVQVKGTQVCTNAINNLTATRAKIVSFALDQVGKIPYYEGGLASVAGYDGNDFGVTTTDDGAGRTSKGLNSAGFVNWVYWSVIDDNLGNTNSIDTILSQGFEVTQDKLLMGDIGYSSDKTIIGIYAGDNKWIMEDAVTGNVVAKPDDRMTMFIRLNTFKFETYNYTIRENKPTSSEWGGSNMLVPPSKPSLIGECPWYAKNRAAEIITELYNNGSLTDAQYNKYLKRVKSTSGDGGTFYPGGAADNGYTGSTNIEDLRAGSFIGMSSQKSDAGKKYGHVAIVEYVSEDLIVITEGWRLKNPQTYCSSYSDFSCVEFRHKTFNSYQEFYNYYHDPNGYMMKGYLYFLED